MTSLFHRLLCIYICASSFTLFAAYKVDLSSPPETRWHNLVNQYSQEDLRQYAAMIDKSINDANYVLGFTGIRKFIMTYGWNGSMDIDPEWFTDLRAEVKGLSDALRERMDGESLRGFKEEDLFILNIGYDFSTYCTTGVYQTCNGPILFRNLDWEGDEYRKFTVEAEFEKNGVQICRSIQFLGQVGLLTAMKPHAYAVALNYRKTPGTGTFGWQIVHNVSQFVFKDGWSSAILLRYTMEHEHDFQGAKARLESTQLIGPCYLTLAGTLMDEGVILERGRESTHARTFSDPFENPRFLVQTNHDIPKPNGQDESWAGNDPLLNESLGMGTVSRRNAAIDFLSTIDETHPQHQLLEMITSHRPVFNPLTIFSSLLYPEWNELKWVAHMTVKANYSACE